jgi:hypothetical protein
MSERISHAFVRGKNHKRMRTGRRALPGTLIGKSGAVRGYLA